MKVRWKLALVYGLLFLITGGVLVGTSYQLVDHRLPKDTVAQASGLDVLLRAEKLSASPGLSSADRSGLAGILEQPPTEVLRFLAKAEGNGDIRLSAPTKQALTATLPLTVRSAALNQLLVQSLIVLGVLSVVSVGLGWLVAGRALRPLRTITDTAAELSASNLDRRIALRGPDDELSRLASTFDAMLDRLAAAFEGQRRFVAHASHELRTPLTVMATEIDVTMRRSTATTQDWRVTADIVRAGIDRADRLITSLLALARVDERLETVEAADLATIARMALHRADADASDAGVSVTHDLAAAPVTGDPGLLDRLVDNLVQNAVVHNVEGGWLHISTGVRGEAAELVVSNSGPVVDPGDVPKLFIPFERLDSAAASGRRLGLGLSVVRAIATAHAGAVEAVPRKDGGLRLTVRLPMSSALP